MSRCYADYLFKFFDEVKIIMKAYRFTDFSEAQIRGGKQFSGFADSQFRKVLGIGEAGFIFLSKS